MKGVEYLVGSPEITNIPLQPYHDDAMEFAATLSRNLMKSPYVRQYPDISAFAFWCRKANLQKRKDGFLNHDLRLGRGLCFHVAPGNIPINFAFSFMFGLLSGCSNIVRISSKPFPQIAPVCEAINETIEAFPEIKARNAFVRYGHDNDITAAFCMQADARIIWGGDETIGMVRGMQSKPRCVDVCFADRYSVCVVDGNTVLDADEQEMTRLADGFYNDTYLMDQNACSSEQLIFWINSSDEAKRKFWDSIERFAESKYELQTAVSVDKYTQMFEDILDDTPVRKVYRKTNYLYRVELEKLQGNVTHLRGKGGYFYEYDMLNLSEIATHVNDKFQTITYFGCDPHEIRQFVLNHRLRGIDRIVPVGKAMDIDIMWDGFDLVGMLSRYIDVR